MRWIGCCLAVLLGTSACSSDRPVADVDHTGSDGGEDAGEVPAPLGREANRPPSITSTPPTVARELDAFVYRVEASDPDGDPLVITLDEGADFAILGADGRLQWTPQLDQQGTQHFRVLVSDGLLETAQEFDVEIEDVNQAPRITSFPRRCPERDPYGGGSEYAYEVLAYDVEDDDLTLALIDGPPGMAVDGMTLRWTPSGSATDVVIEVRDAKGATVRQSFRVGVPGGGGGAAATATITSPASAAEIAQTVPVIGTATGSLYYELVLAKRPRLSPIVIASEERVIEGGGLGFLPASTVRNGRYLLTLRSYDESCNAAEASVDVQVVGGAKLGPQRLEYTDAEITTGDLAVRVERIYDTLDLTVGDFGVGWHMTASDLRAEQENDPSPDWEAVNEGGALPTYSLVGQTRYVTIETSEEPRPEFAFAPYFEQPIDPRFVKYDYFDTTGSDLELECIGCDDSLIFTSGEITDLDFRPFRANGFAVTYPDGTRMTFGSDGHATSVGDRFGNSVALSPTSITHDSGASLQIERGAENLVTAVTDPLGRRVEYAYSSRRELDSVRYADGSGFDYEYANGRVVRIGNAMGETVQRFEYDIEGRTQLIIYADGRQESFEYDVEEGVTYRRDAAGRETATRYGERGEVIESSDAMGAMHGYEYDELGRTVAEVDETGERLERTYDENNRITSESGQGSTLAVGYGAFDEPTQMTTTGGDGVLIDLDAQGKPTRYASSDGVTVDVATDESGNLTRIADSRTCDTRREFDAASRLVATDDGIVQTRIVYDAVGRTIETETSEGVSRFEYDGRDRLTRIEHPSGDVTTREYDLAGRVVRERDVSGEITFAYDPAGRLIRETYADGTSRRISYGDLGLVTAETSRLGGVTRYEYDDNGRRTAMTMPDGSVRRWEHDGLGRVVSETDGAGGETRFELDAAGRVVRQWDPEGRVTSVDAPPERADPMLAGLVSSDGASSISNGMNAIGLAYDPQGRPTGATMPDGSSVTAMYGPTNRPTGFIDEEGRLTSHDLDCRGRVLAVAHPGGERVEYTWTPNGEIASITNGEGHTTELDHLPGGRLSRVTLPMGQSRQTEYEGSLPARQIDFDGSATVFSHDDLGRETRVGYADGSFIAREWGPAGPVRLVDERGDYRIDYDVMARPARISYPEGEPLRLGYDGAGRITSRETDSFSTQYVYDGSGIMTRVQAAAGVVRLDYDEARRPTSTILPTGARVQQIWDERDRASTIAFVDAIGTTRRLEYVYDRSNRMTEMHDGDAVVHYTYTPTGHLASETRTGSSPYERAYEYDRAGNRTAVVADGERTEYVLDANNRITRATSPAGVTQFTWNDKGELVDQSGPDGHFEFAYDSRGLLLRMTGPGFDRRLTWDAFGRLAKIEDAGAETRYLVDPFSETPRILEVIDANGAIGIAYGDQALVATDGSAPMLDATGTPVGAFGADGTSSEPTVRTAFGELISGAASPFVATGFHGQLELAPGFVLMGVRVYSAALGRFLSADTALPTVERSFSENGYVYGRNNPLSFTDPSGFGEFSFSGLLTSIGIWMTNVGMRLTPIIGAFSAAAATRLQRMMMAIQNSLRAQWWNRQTYAYHFQLQNYATRAPQVANGPCASVSAQACNTHLGNPRTMEAVWNVFLRNRSFRAGNGTYFQNTLNAFRDLFGLRGTQLANIASSPGVTHSQRAIQTGMTSNGPYLVRVEYADGSRHVMYAFRDNIGPVITNWIANLQVVSYEIWQLTPR